MKKYTLRFYGITKYNLRSHGKAKFTLRRRQSILYDPMGWKSVFYDPMGWQSILYEEGKVYFTNMAKYTLRSHGMSKFTLRRRQSIPYEEGKVYFTIPWDVKVYFTIPWYTEEYFRRLQSRYTLQSHGVQSMLYLKLDHSCWAVCARIAPVYISVCRKEYITNRLQTPKYNKRKKEENKRQWDKYPPPEKSQAWFFSFYCTNMIHMRS